MLFFFGKFSRGTFGHLGVSDCLTIEIWEFHLPFVEFVPPNWFILCRQRKGTENNVVAMHKIAKETWRWKQQGHGPKCFKFTT
jgi:hypothetical protein